jgi:hypothetical protein
LTSQTNRNRLRYHNRLPLNRIRCHSRMMLVLSNRYRTMALLLHNFRFRMWKQLNLLHILNRIDWTLHCIPYRTGP